jgi:hypothetical protein
MTDPIDTARQEGIALGLAMAADASIMAQPPDGPEDEYRQRVECQKAILALTPIPPCVAAARVLLDDWDRVGDQRRAGTHQVKWGEAWDAMSAERRELDWNDWPALFLAALEQIAKEEG